MQNLKVPEGVVSRPYGAGKSQNYLFLFILSGVLLLPLVSLAQGLVPCGNPGQPACQFCHFFVLFKNVIDFLLIRIVPVVAVLMLVIGGAMYIFAYFEMVPKGGTGGPALLSRAKSLFTYTIVGLIIIYASWLIINLFFQVIGVADWTGLKAGWWKIDCPAPGTTTTTPTTPTPPPTSPPNETTTNGTTNGLIITTGDSLPDSQVDISYPSQQSQPPESRIPESRNIAFAQSSPSGLKLQVSGGKPPYNWSLVLGNLPPGLQLSTDGVISGKPTAPGTYTFTIQVTSGKEVASKQFSIIIFPAVKPLTIITPSLPSGTVGTQYSTSISATGGNGSYSWSLASGTLPPGLNLVQGVCIAIVGPCQAPVEISGTPTTAGNYTFTILVSDGASKASRQFTIIIALTPPPGYSESFENSFGGWMPDHQIDCEPSCRFDWSLERSNLRAYDGVYSLKGYLDGRNDDGTIWVERSFEATPNAVIDYEISFYLWSESDSGLNRWPVVAYIGLRNPEQERDFSIVGNTDEFAGWKIYSYGTRLSTDSRGVVWMAFGFGATYEVNRTYFLDFVQINLIPRTTATSTAIQVQVNVNALNVRQDGALSATKIRLDRA